ncbi:MAG: large repetitive protein, partial [Gaiellaceae bacterium]|nr:large repetitive protein [Gaiellaceae bacterium]
MSVLTASRRRRILLAAASLALTGLGLARPAAARVVPEFRTAGATVAIASAGLDAPKVSLSVSPLVAPGAPVNARATALTTVSSISVGYCPGFTCSTPFATRLVSVPGGALDTTWTNLPPDGVYTLVASAVTAGGAIGQSTPLTVTVKGTVPDRTLISAPSATVAVASASAQPGSTVQPASTVPGTVDPTPVVATSKAVAATALAATALAATAPPETTITDGPGALVNSRNASIRFSSDSALATFQCSVDGGAYVPCLTPRPVLNRADGPHVFRVRAVLGGLTDPTPAETSWTIDATAPAVTVSPSRPADGKGWYGSAVSFTTTGTDTGGAVTCTAPQTYDGPDVSHTPIVGSCTDLAGNVG